MNLRLLATQLTASGRTVRGMLLPFNEDGQTNLGRVRASAGTLTVAPPPLVLNVEHRDADVLGTLSVTETPAGWDAAADVLPTRAGDDALAEIAAGVRNCLSVEVEDPVIAGGELTAGTITGGGLVRRPAYPSAKLAAAYAPDTTPTTKEERTMTDQTAPPTPPTAPIAPPPAPTTPPPASAQAPAGGLIASLHGAPKQPASGTADLFAALASAAKATGGDPRRMLAALSDIVPGDVLGLEQPQYVGQLWNGNAYARQVVPLFNHADLTSFDVHGWRWVTKPAVATYAGNKAAVPSNDVSTEAVTVDASRIAGAHDIDRKFLDFKSDGFWAAYYAAMTESYKRVSDATVLSAVRAEAKTVTSGAVPAGVAPGMVKVVDGALAVLTGTDTVPTFALVAADLWRAVMLTRSDDVLAHLTAAMGLEGGNLAGFTLRPSAQLAAGEVLVGNRSAATVHELGGEAPIRVEAPNIAQGGVDSGVFGYLATMVHDTDGLVIVDKDA